MKKISLGWCIMMIASMLGWNMTSADSVCAAQYTDRYDELEKCEWKSDNGTLLYRKYTPKESQSAKNGEKFPLIIFLHGAGERGNNNVSQVAGQDAFLNLIFSEEGAKYPAFLIAPQCQNGKKWCEVDWGRTKTHDTPKQASEGMTLLHELLQDMKANLPIDPSRIYVTGISMGGYGTYDFIVRYPSEVAAAIPICGGADNEKLETMTELRTIPVWIFHGDADGAVPTARSRNAFAALQKNKCDVQYTEYPKVGHNCWDRAYRTEGLADWLFAQKKK